MAVVQVKQSNLIHICLGKQNEIFRFESIVVEWMISMICLFVRLDLV
jgi:hypothetical protein